MLLYVDCVICTHRIFSDCKGGGWGKEDEYGRLSTRM